MGWNLPPGCTDADIDRACPGYDEELYDWEDDAVKGYELWIEINWQRLRIVKALKWLRDDLAFVEQQLAKYSDPHDTVRLMWDQRRAALQEEIAALEGQHDRAGRGGMMWRLIETAPKDGTHILLWAQISDDSGACGPMAIEGYWQTYDDSYHRVGVEDGWMTDLAIGDGLGIGPPTHWMPLPAPPYDKASSLHHGASANLLRVATEAAEK